MAADVIEITREEYQAMLDLIAEVRADVEKMRVTLAIIFGTGAETFGSES